MTIVLSPLPYEAHALEPHISAETLKFHHGKHHQAYVHNLNALIKGSDLEGLALEDIIQRSYQHPDRAPIFNNAAQVWNHTFYWASMKPQGGGQPGGSLKQAIDQVFGAYDTFKTRFKEAALTQFGSGWAWLVVVNGQLDIQKTGNADLPLARKHTPLLTLDVWEHAYYLDYQNRRPDYVDIYLDHLVNWDFAAQNWSTCTGRHG